MTDDLENLSYDEIKKRYEEAKKAEMLEELKAKEQKKLEDAKAEEKKAWEEEFLKKHPEYAPDDGLGETGTETKKKENKNIHAEVLKRYEQRYKRPFYNYDSGKWLLENTDDDSGCEDDVSEWSPADVYSTIIWNTAICESDLLSIAVKGLDIKQGNGLTVQIRKYGQFSAPTELGSCECASCSSISFSTYSLTLKQYNNEYIVCEKDIWDVGQVLSSSYLDAAKDSWKAFFDWQIYNELETATAGTSVTLNNALVCTPSIGGSCCTDTSLMDLYDAIHSAVDTAREGTNPYNPDVLIASPSVLGIFRRMQTPTPMYWMSDVKVDSSGNLTEIAGLKVIPYCRANSCATTSAEVMAIIIDSRYAVGAAFGQKPKMFKKFEQSCNSWQVDFWAFFACAELDTNAIIHIVNP